MTLDNTESQNTVTPEGTVGYGRPPKNHQFKKGAPSANPNGRPRKAKSDLLGLFETRLHEEVPSPDRKRSKISRLRLMLRKHVEKASNGDVKSLKEVVRMLKAREEEAGPTEPDWRVVRYSHALAARPRQTFTEEFYKQNEKDVARWRAELKAGNTSIKAMLEKELSRKIDMPKSGGGIRKITLMEVIVARFFRAAAEEASILHELLSLIPEKKRKRDSSRIEFLRPTQEEIAWCGSPDDDYE